MSSPSSIPRPGPLPRPETRPHVSLPRPVIVLGPAPAYALAGTPVPRMRDGWRGARGEDAEVLCRGDIALRGALSPASVPDLRRLKHGSLKNEQESRKSSEERAVFHDFIKKSGLPINPESVESCCPSKPDILCFKENEGNVAFVPGYSP
jgi:hypothetical protein